MASNFVCNGETNELVSEDEDVVFEGSELHKHFENVGFNSAEYVCISRSSGNKQCKENFLNRKQFRNLWNRFSTPLSCVKSIFEFVIPSAKSVQPLYCKTYFQMILDSDVLTHEDATYLENCLNDTAATDPESSRSCLWLYAPGLSLLAILLAKYYREGTVAFNVFSSANVVTLGLGAYCIREAITHWQKFKEDRRHRCSQQQLASLLQNCSTLVKLLKKAIHLIQELELVSRGFTFIFPQAPGSKTESSMFKNITQQQCPALRQTSFLSARELLNIFRLSTIQLLRNFKLNSGVDHDSHYIATLPNEGLGSLLITPVEQLELLQQETDNFSLSAIKTIWQLSCVQVSEYFRRLCLCLSPELYCLDDKCRVYTAIPDVIESIDQQVVILLTRMQQSYHFHKSAMNTTLPTRCNQSGKRTKKENLNLVVHSLALHLQSALLRVLNIDNHLNETDVVLNTNDEDCYDTLLHHLQSVKMELDACCVCQDETQKQLDFVFDKNVPAQRSAPWLSEETSLNKTETNEQSIPLFEMGDPVAEDQVFEAFANDSENEDCSDENDTDFIIEKEIRKQQKETNKNMLNELQSILTVKAKEWQEREAKALAKSRGFCLASGDNLHVQEPNFDISSLLKSSGDNHRAILPPIKPGTEIFPKDLSLPPSNLGFAASIASMAAARSQHFSLPETETFSDSGESADELSQ